MLVELKSRKGWIGATLVSTGSTFAAVSRQGNVLISNMTPELLAREREKGRIRDSEPDIDFYSKLFKDLL